MTGGPFPPQHITDETGHGRHDVRVIRTAPATDAIRARWPGTSRIFLIERYRHPRTRAMGDISACRLAGQDAARNLLACASQLGAKVSCESVTGITSLTPAKAAPASLLAHNRNHWALRTACTTAATQPTAKTPARSAPAAPPASWQP